MPTLASLISLTWPWPPAPPISPTVFAAPSPSNSLAVFPAVWPTALMVLSASDVESTIPFACAKATNAESSQGSESETHILDFLVCVVDVVGKKRFLRNPLYIYIYIFLERFSVYYYCFGSLVDSLLDDAYTARSCLLFFTACTVSRKWGRVGTVKGWWEVSQGMGGTQAADSWLLVLRARVEAGVSCTLLAKACFPWFSLNFPLVLTDKSEV